MKITLCGSTRFMDEWHEWNGKLSAAGHIVYSLALFKRELHDSTDTLKTTLDLVHLAKIEESDAIFVLNKEDYIGESTRRELAWARMRQKKIYWLEASKFKGSFRLGEYDRTQPGFYLDLGVE